MTPVALAHRPGMRTYLATATSNPLIVGEPGVTLLDANNAVIYVTHRFAGATGHPPLEGGSSDRQPEAQR